MKSIQQSQSTSARFRQSFIKILVVVVLVVVATLCGRLVAPGILQYPSLMPLLSSSTSLQELLHVPAESNVTIVVTGANRGLGLATVQHLASFLVTGPVTIVMACRKAQRCDAAREQILKEDSPTTSLVNLVSLSLDLESTDSIDEFCHHFSDQQQPIHVLINNAGFVGGNATSKDDAIERHIRVNHLGHFRLMHGLWNNLERANGRIVVVSSALGALPWNVLKGWSDPPSRRQLPWMEYLQQWIRYGRSKRANLMVAQALFYRTTSSNVTIAASHPGYTRTSLFTSSFGETRFNLFLRRGWGGGLGRYFSMTPEAGAWTQVAAALAASHGSYVGPRWGVVGDPVVSGTLERSWHHIPTSQQAREALWKRSLLDSGISEFGNAIVVSDQCDALS